MITYFKEKPTGWEEPNVIHTPCTKTELKVFNIRVFWPNSGPHLVCKRVWNNPQNLWPRVFRAVSCTQLLNPWNKKSKWFKVMDWKNICTVFLCIERYNYLLFHPNWHFSSTASEPTTLQAHVRDLRTLGLLASQKLLYLFFPYLTPSIVSPSVESDEREFSPT